MVHLLEHKDWASSPLGSGPVGQVTCKMGGDGLRGE